MEHIGKLQIDTRKIERSPQYFRPSWTNIDHIRFDYELCAIRRGASKEKYQAGTSSTKNTNITLKYTLTDRKKTKKVGYAVVLSDNTIRRRQLPQNSIISAEQSAIINAIHSTTTKNK
jgi:hypothetical protein